MAPAVRKIDHSREALRYAERVVSGKIPACEWVKRAGERHLQDLDTAKDRGLKYDRDRANRVCRFAELMPHIKGEWAKGRQRIVLQPWQKFAYCNLFGWQRHRDLVVSGMKGLTKTAPASDREWFRRYRTGYLEVPRKNSKALALDTLIPVPGGMRTMRELRPGDVVYGMDGQPKTILRESPIYFGHRCLEVEFSTGERIVCDEGHLWLTRAQVDSPGQHVRKGMRRGESCLERPRTAEEIRRTVTYGSRGDRNHSVPVAAPLAGEVQDFLIDPYVLGVWLGDGHTDAGRITAVDVEILDAVRMVEGEIRRAGTSVSYAVGESYRKAGVRQEDTFQGRLRAVGVLGCKHIPKPYLRAATHQRAQLLKGLMDTDGSVSRVGQCTYCSTSERLALDVHELLSTLGIKATVTRRDAVLNGRRISDYWQVQFWPGFPVFSLARKLTRQKCLGARNRQGYRTIVAVREVPSVPVKCLQVEGGLYLVGRSCIPTHNSTMGAIAGLYMLAPDEEEGAECVSAATTRKQAGAVWEVARYMTLRTPRFRERYGIDVYRHSLVREATASNFVALSKESETLDGLNLHFGNVDELHAHKDRSLWDVLDTAMGSRAEPLLLAITTAGGNQDGICFEQRSYLMKILQGLLEDDSFWGIIYTIDDAEAWDDPKQWAIANPNYGVSVDPVKLADAAKKARFSAAALNNFKTKHLNVWVSAASAWANMEEWKAGTLPELHEYAARELATAEGRRGSGFGIPPEFDARECWISGDLASKIDIASLALIFPDPDGGITVFGRHYLPEDLVEELAGKTGGHYAQWADRGWLTLTSGNTADFDRIEAEIEAAAGRFKLLGYCYDPWQSHQMVGHLTEKRLPCAEIKPTVANYSPAMKELEALVKGRKVRHDGNPCGLWMVSNVVVKEDYKGNIYPRKERKTAKIDWLVALLGGVNRLIVHQPDDSSVYDRPEREGGLLVVG